MLMRFRCVVMCHAVVCIYPASFSLLSVGAGAEKLLKFKKWFWSIVEKMSNSDRQDLVSIEAMVQM